MSSSSRGDASGRRQCGRLGFFLCWAVVFADIGTSVYYTPGILYGQVGKLAGFFAVRAKDASQQQQPSAARVKRDTPVAGGESETA